MNVAILVSAAAVVGAVVIRERRLYRQHTAWCNERRELERRSEGR